MMDECFASDKNANHASKSKWIIRMEIDKETLLDKNITMDDIHFAIKNSEYGKSIHCVYSDYNMDKLVFRIRIIGVMQILKKKKTANPLDQSDNIFLLKNLQDSLMNDIILRGITNITNVTPRKLQNMLIKEDGAYTKKDLWVLDTTGTNLLDTLALDFIDYKRTYSNDIKEVFEVLGIEATRQIIYNELVDVMDFSDIYINYHHLSVLCDRMTLTKNLVSIYRTGILNDDIGPIAKATFEVHTEVFLNAARHGDFDHMRGVSSNIMCGQFGHYGTNSFRMVLDLKEIESHVDDVDIVVKDRNEEIEESFGYAQTEKSDVCSKKNIEIQNNISNILDNGVGVCDDDYDLGL
jgi:DNA-directed RNA polymerase II subunit RPB1